MDYLSVKEVAEIRKCSVQYIKKCCKDGKIEAIQRPHPQNKCMCYMIPVTALSEQEQLRYYKKIKQEAGFLPAPVKEKTDLKYNLKTVKRPFESFSETERNEISFWTNLINCWQSERNAYKGLKTEFDKMFSAHQKYLNPELDISPAILYRKLSAYKNNHLELLLDNRGGWNRGKSKLDDNGVIWRCFLQLYLDDNAQKVAECYRETVAYIEEEHPELVESIPSLDTFRRKLKKNVPDAVLAYTRNGTKYARDNFAPYAQRMTDTINANEIWVMDNYTFDILCKNEDGVTATKRFYLTGVLDVKSGVLVGYNISDSPDSQSTLIALRQALLKYGFCEYIYFDNGREFTPADFSKKKGSRKVSEKNKEHFPVHIFEKLGIKIQFAEPHNARAKAIERAHLTFKNQFCRNFMGWCGGNILERPESLKRHIKNGVIETETELRQLFGKYIDYYYNVQQYGGDENKYKGMSRIDVWNSSIQNVTLKVADETALDIWTMRTNGFQKIQRDGVYITVQGAKIPYYDQNLVWQNIGKEVCVRYDPCHLQTVRIYDTEDRYLWTWEIADYFMREYINESSENIAEFRRIEKNTMKKIKNRADELKGKKFIDRKTGIKYVIKKGEKQFAIHMPKNIQPVILNEEPMKKAAGAENMEFVSIDLSKMIENSKKRKGE